jgi:integrase
VREWIGEGRSDQIRRMRARSIKALLRWVTEEEITDASWYRRVKLPNVKETPQETATEADFRRALAKAYADRDRALLAVLWSSGMRRAEVARMRVEHVDLDGGNVLVPFSKMGKFRVAPLSPEACKLLRVYLRKHPQIGATGPLWIRQRGVINADAIPRILDRLDAPSAHAFRRGWTVDSLKHGVSQTSVQAAAGWASGRGAVWISGEGEWASISRRPSGPFYDPAITIQLYPTLDAARRAKAVIDRTACGSHCQGPSGHTVEELVPSRMGSTGLSTRRRVLGRILD